MAKKSQKPSAGPGAARQRGSAAQGRARPRGDFGLAALIEVTGTSSHGMLLQSWTSCRCSKLPNSDCDTAFSMKDEARNTGHGSSLWGRDTRLRAKPIGFVSAGLIEPLEDQPQNPQDDPSLNGVDNSVTANGDAVLPTEEQDVTLDTLEQPLASTESSAFPDPAIAVDTPHIADLPFPADLGFMIDVTGDKTLAASITHSQPRISDPQSSAEESDSSSGEVILFKGRDNLPRGNQTVLQSRTKQTITLDTIRYEIKAVEAQMTPIPNTTRNKVQTSRAQPQHRVNPGNFEEIDDEEEAIIADYIANMAEDSDDGDDGPYRQPFMSADLGGADGDFGNDTSEATVASDDSAASDDDQKDEIHIVGDAGADHSSGGDDTAGPTMDDETLARLLAKQEELGMGSDELLLASGAAGGRGSAYYGKTPQKSQRGRARSITKGSSPNAHAVVDAFDDLDLMDWERPSLHSQRKRGRRGKMPVFDDISDTETLQHLQTSYQNDREAKKLRKLRREDLRVQGLLGKHANPDDPRLKYPNGMSTEDIKTVMRSFLVGSEPR